MPDTREMVARREALRDLIREHVIRSQRELSDLLRARGFEATQSSISRDLADLQVSKVRNRYVLPSGGTPVTRQTPSPLEAVLSIQPAGPNLLVLRTPAGQAGAVGLAIDDAGWADVAGCIAGDDTVFVAVPGRAEQAAVRKRIEQFRKDVTP